MHTARNDPVTGALAQMDRHAQHVKVAVLAAAAVEAVLLVVALLNIDWANATHVLLFALALLGYTVMVLGLAALGAHVSRVGARVVAALDDRPGR